MSRRQVRDETENTEEKPVKPVEEKPVRQTEKKGLKIIDWEVIQQEKFQGQRNLRELDGQVILISSFRVEDRGEGRRVAIIETDRGVYYTFSKVVIRQLEAAKDYLDRGYVVRARVRAKDKYITLE